MNEREFEEFIKHMTIFLERKYNVVHHREEKKEEKKEEKEKKEDKKEDKPAADNTDNIDDFAGLIPM